MSRTATTLFVGVLAVILVGGCFGGYQLYQRHYLSSGMKRTLTAAMDPSATESDIRTYIRDARLQVHTSRDAKTADSDDVDQSFRFDADQIGAKRRKALSV